MRLPALTTLLVSGAALMACASADRINGVHYNGYSGADLGYAVGSGPIPVKVIGAPQAGVDRADAAAKIGEAMHGANLGPVVHYAVYEGGSPAGYVMVVRFGAGTNARNICGADAVGGVGPDYGAAFCKDGQALSYLTGKVGATAIDSRGFRAAMAGAASQLLPLENPDYKDDDDSIFRS